MPLKCSVAAPCARIKIIQTAEPLLLRGTRYVHDVTACTQCLSPLEQSQLIFVAVLEHKDRFVGLEP